MKSKNEFLNLVSSFFIFLNDLNLIEDSKEYTEILSLEQKKIIAKKIFQI